MGHYLETCRGCGKPRNAETTGTFVNYRGERVLRSRCLDCTAAYTRQWRRKSSAYDGAKIKAREDYARRKAADPELNRWRELRRNYGMSQEQYESLLVSQGGVCAACGGLPTGKRTVFDVDHCHKTGVVRALLCHRCNRALGMVGDDVGLLRKLASYLERHPMVITTAPEL